MAEDWPPPKGVADLAFLMAVDKRVRDRVITNLKAAWCSVDAKADDYVLVGPGETE